LPSLAEETLDVLRAVLPASAGLNNPIDMIATATPDQYEIVAQQVLQDPGIDALIVLNVSVGGGRTDAYVDGARRGVETAQELLKTPKPVLSCFMAPGGVPAVSRSSDENAVVIPAYRFPEAPARALARLWQYRAWLDRPRGREVQPEDVDAEGARAIVQSALERVRAAGDPDAAEWLTPDENARLLRAAGIPSPAFREVTTVDDAVRMAAEFGRPVAVKVISSTIVHKTDVGGVALDLATPEAVRAACNDMVDRLGDAVEGFLVQEMVREGTEVLLGITSDPTFGPLVAFGLGGTAVEVLQDVSFRVTPLTNVDAADLLRSIRGYPLLEAHRGRPRVDTRALEDLVLRLSWLAGAVPQIREMDLNPVRVFADGESLAVVDVRTAVRV
jgi:acyl-CoA synthetase (NDP forming)